MDEVPFDVAKVHRWFAVELNNRAWDLLESGKWTDEEAEVMLHGAHASCYHWLQIGRVENHARALCLIANVYAALGLGSDALRHAQHCVGLVEENADELADWDQAFAHDCLARAQAADGQAGEALQSRHRARDLGDRIAVPEEKEIFDKWFAAGNWHGIS